MPVANNLGRPAPSAEGTLDHRPLPHLLVYAHDRQLSGTFEFSGPNGQEATVVVVAGQPTKVRSAEAVAYLGLVLIDLGILSVEEFEDFLPNLSGGAELHGKFLVDAGAITEEQLELGLRAQVVRKLRALAHLPPETTFRYYNGLDALEGYGGQGYGGVDPYPTIWACIRELPPWKHVERGLNALTGAGLVLSASAETGRFAFEKPERITVELIRDKPRRLKEILAQSPLEGERVKLLVYCLLITKQVDLVRESRIPAPMPPDEDWGPPAASGERRAATLSMPRVVPIGDPLPRSAQGPPLSSSLVSPSIPAAPASAPVSSSVIGAPPSSRDVGPPSSGNQTPELATHRQEIQETAARVDKQDHYAVLGVRRDAPAAEIQRRFLTLARRWHPERLHPELIDMRELCAKVFLRVADAQQTLLDPTKRAAYDALTKIDAPKSQRNPLSMPTPMAQGLHRPRITVTMAKVSLPSESKSVETTPPSSRLSGPPSSRLSNAPSPQESGPPSSRLSAPPSSRMSGPPSSRLSGPPSSRFSNPPGSIRVPAVLSEFQLAEEAAKQQHFAAADRILRERCTPEEAAESNFKALATWVRANLPDGDVDAALSELEFLVMTDSRCESALYYRGLLFKRIRQDKAALRDFVTLAKMNPKHMGALVEIKLIRDATKKG